MNRVSILTSVCLLTASVGCTSTTLLETSRSALKSPMSLIGARSPKPVVKILCLWEPAEGQGLDEKPTRGFAGQIMFFTYGQASPIQVDGTVRIFEYSNFDADESDPTPIHEFIFEAKAWNAHCTEGTLGYTYNVFLPYVEKNKKNAICALRVEFESKDGRKSSAPFTEVSLISEARNRPAKAIQRDVVSKPVRQRSPRNGQQVGMTNVDDEPEENQLETMTITMPKAKAR